MTFVFTNPSRPGDNSLNLVTLGLGVGRIHQVDGDADAEFLRADEKDPLGERERGGEANREEVGGDARGLR